jgi:hypothetical protein
MAEKYEVTGLKKRQYRGDSSPTTIKQTVSADSAEKAGDKFEKDNPKYDGKVFQKLSQASTPAPEKEKADTDGKPTK